MSSLRRAQRQASFGLSKTLALTRELCRILLVHPPAELHDMCEDTFFQSGIRLEKFGFERLWDLELLFEQPTSEEFFE
ncbi:MAG: hypothetical protein QM784_12965 [Polyangiaceae bacterium]